MLRIWGIIMGYVERSWQHQLAHNITSIAPISPIHLEDTQAVPLADEMASKILCIFALVSTYPSPFWLKSETGLNIRSFGQEDNTESVK